MRQNVFEQQLSNGTWQKVDDEKIDRYIDAVLDRESWYAPRIHREPMKTINEVIEYLKTGKSINWGDDWYARIKIAIPASPHTEPEMVKCVCGHIIPKKSVMMTSMGTSCPECYDRMSM